jgi:lysine/ornithine N-monooxygenase
MNECLYVAFAYSFDTLKRLRNFLLSFSINYKRIHKALYTKILEGLYKDRIEKNSMQGIIDKEDNDVSLCG